MTLKKQASAKWYKHTDPCTKLNQLLKGFFV